MAKTKKAKVMERALAEARVKLDPSYKPAISEVAPVVRQTTVSTYEPYVKDFFVSLREGDSISGWVKRNKLPFRASAIRSYVWRYHRDEYESAIKESAEAVAEKAVQAASERDEAKEVIETTLVDGSVTTAVKTFDNTNRSRLATDAYWRMAAAKDPSRFGAKASQAESVDLAREIIQARRRIASEKEAPASGQDSGTPN